LRESWVETVGLKV